MKTKSIGLFGLVPVLALLLAGCSRNVKGTYNCKGGIFLQSVTLESSDKALVSGNVFGTIQQKTGTYKVDGDNVVITVDGQSTPFNLKDKTLDGGELGGICTAQ
jgi:hypothetical protein